MKVFKKEVFCIFLSMLIFALIAALPLALSLNATAVDETSALNRAHSWISSQVRGKWPATVDEDAFALLAISDDAALASEGKTALLGKSLNEQCWPSSGCNVRSTALALLALNPVGVDTANIQAWLLSKKKQFTENINWYLQIDSPETAKCNITYAGKRQSVTIAANKQLSFGTSNGTGTTCLSLSTSPAGYWLKIGGAGCFNYTYTVTCDKDFTTSILYTKGMTIYVSSKMLSGGPGYTLENTIDSYCLGLGSCDYEGTLWAAIALKRAGEDVSMLLPFISSQSDSYASLLPDAFLYELTGSTEYGDNLFASQTAEGFWQASGSSYGKFYDSALALMVLLKGSAEYGNISSAKNYLFSVQTTGTEGGSWGNSLRDTAFILYAMRPPMPSTYTGNLCSDNGGSCKLSCAEDEEALPSYDSFCSGGKICCASTISACELGGDKCRAECLSNEDEVAGETSCGDKICCELKTCLDIGGELCESGQECNGTTVNSKEGTCCTEGNCIETLQLCSQLNGVTCEKNEKCSGKIEASSDTDSCCVGGECKKAGLWWLWILIAVALAAFAYFQRDKLKAMFAKKPSRPGPSTGFPPRPMPPYPPRMPPMMQARQAPVYNAPPRAYAARPPVMSRPPPRPPAGRLPPSKIRAPKPTSKKTSEEELDETLKRLRKLIK